MQEFSCTWMKWEERIIQGGAGTQILARMPITGYYRVFIYLSPPLPSSTHKWMGHFAMILSEDMLVRSQTRINGTPPLREWWIHCIAIWRHTQKDPNSSKIRQSAKNRQFWASVENWHTQTYEIVMLVLKSRGYTHLRMGRIISEV